MSGTGKSTISLELMSKFTECVVLDSDFLWRAEFNTPENDYYSFRSSWLEVAANISQSGRAVALFAIADSERYEILHARQYFSTIHYLLYTCSDEVLTQRLKARPEWRQSRTATFIETMINFNQHLLTTAKTTSVPVTILDTGTLRSTGYNKDWNRKDSKRNSNSSRKTLDKRGLLCYHSIYARGAVRQFS